MLNFDAFGPSLPADAVEVPECLACTDTDYCDAHWPGGEAPCRACYDAQSLHSVSQSESCARELGDLARFDRDQNAAAVLDREAL